jgi:hypothetical protein
MLFRSAPLDLARNVIVVVHVPKTAGSALCDALFEHFGPEQCFVADSPEKIGKIHPNRLHRLAWTMREELRMAAMRLRGGEPRLAEFHSRAELQRFQLFEGHFALGAEPKISRKPVYLTLVREPVDRFLSQYYYAHDLRAKWPEGSRDRHPYWTYDIDRFVDYAYARRRWTDANLQCRLIGGAANFAAARRAVDDRVFLAAPSQRLDDCLELLQPVLGLRSTVAPRSNVGNARQGQAPPSPAALAKIREMTSEDQLLFDYVSRVFDDLYREFAGARRIG